jgi:hypothetical protein
LRLNFRALKNFERSCAQIQTYCVFAAQVPHLVGPIRPKRKWMMVVAAAVAAAAAAVVVAAVAAVVANFVALPYIENDASFCMVVTFHKLYHVATSITLKPDLDGDEKSA